MNIKKLAYLAAPFSHPDAEVREYRYRCVTRAAFEFHKQGRFVYSPLTHNTPLIKLDDKVTGWETWCRFDELMLRKCDELIVLQLEGWKESRGVAAEIKIAEQIGIQIEMLQPSETMLQEALA